MARLEMQRDSRTKEYELGDEMIMGRKSSCQIRVPSPKCSREHCRIVRGSDCFYIEDLGSSNGTLVNGKKVGSHLLKHNDEIVVGGVTFRFMDRSDDILVSRRLGKYQIIEKVGVGGMGVVYRASQVSLAREVALKVMNKRLAQQENFIQSFEREAKIAARLHHPNIIGIHDFGSSEGWYYFSMEFVDGENLLDLALRQGGLSEEECIEYGSQIAMALEHAHTQGILHKDIKPQNVMIDRDNNVKLADMGLAETMGGDDEVEMESEAKSEDGKKKSFMATPQYVAPEIIRRQDPDARSDLYSLSATLFHMLTGKPPYQDKTVKELLRKHLNAPIPDPRELRKEISDELAEFIMRGLSKEPDDRIQSAREYAEELTKFSKSKTATSRPAPLITSTIRASAPSSSSQSTVKRRTTSAHRAHKSRSSTMQTMLIAGGVVALGIVGFLVLGSGGSDSTAQQLKKAKEYFVNGHDTRAKDLLNSIIRNSPASTAGKEAQKMLDEYEKEYLRQSVSKIHADYSSKAITAQQARRKLEAILGSAHADRSIREIIAPFISELDKADSAAAISIQETASSPWDREVKDLILANKLPQAYSQAEKVWKTTKSQADKSIAWALMEEVKKRNKEQAQKLFTSSQVLEKTGKLPKAVEQYSEILNMVPTVEQAPAAANRLSKINIASLHNLAQAWFGAIEAVPQKNNKRIREAAFQAGKGIEGLTTARQLGIFNRFPQALADFEKALIKNAPEKTKEPNPQIRIFHNGKTPRARLEVENGKLIAVGKKNRKPVTVKDIFPGDLEVLVPRLEATAGEAMGAALWMAATNNRQQAIHYIQALSSSIEDNIPEASALELYSRNIFPLMTMEYFPESGNTFRNSEYQNNELMLSVNGLWTNSELAMKLAGTHMDISQNGTMHIRMIGIAGTVADFYTINGELRVTVIHEGKQMKTSMRCSRGDFTVTANQNGLTIYANEQKRDIAVPGIGDTIVWPMLISKNVTTVNAFTWGKIIYPKKEEKAPDEKTAG